jgi:hypothetical protein
MRALAWAVVGLIALSCATAEETSDTPTGGRGGRGGASGSDNDAPGGASGSGGSTGGALGGGAAGVLGMSGSGGELGSGGATGGSGGSGASGGASGTAGASGASGTNGSAGRGGTSGTAGASGTSGTSGAAGTAGRGGTSGTNGAGGTAGSAGTAGRGGTGGMSGTSGTGGAAGTGGTVCADADRDSLTDCDENGDNNPWTDPAIFNGMHVRLANQCSASGSCSENDTLNEVNQCMNPIAQERDQYSGWDWEDPPDDVCSNGYRFLPNWSNCDSSWAADWQGCIHLEGSGPHCFQIAGGTNEGCAALYFNGNTGNADVQTGGAAKCFSVGTGNYPIRWHYTMDNGSGSSMHVRYCAGTGSNCTPSAAIPSRMLRTRCP